MMNKITTSAETRFPRTCFCRPFVTRRTSYPRTDIDTINSIFYTCGKIIIAATVIHAKDTSRKEDEHTSFYPALSCHATSAWSYNDAKASSISPATAWARKISQTQMVQPQNPWQVSKETYIGECVVGGLCSTESKCKAATSMDLIAWEVTSAS